MTPPPMRERKSWAYWGSGGFGASISERLLQPLDIAPLVFFRIVGVGLITVEILGEWLTGYHDPYVATDFHFSYVLTPWLEPWPPLGVHLHFALNALMGLCVAAGLFYRQATVALFLGTALLFLMEKSVYINHTYLYILIAFLMIFIPAHGAVGIDAQRNPAITAQTAPAWCLWMLRFQMAVVYVFAGLAKLNGDWLSGSPMDLSLAARTGTPILGPLLALDWVPRFMSLGGAALDLLVVPALLWRPTRVPAFLLATSFHLTNVLVYGLGTFPWFSIAATALFFPPETFRKLPFLGRALSRQAVQVESSGVRLTGIDPRDGGVPGGTAHPRRYGRRAIAWGLGAYVLVQLLIPIRPWLYPGNPSWTEYGHNFSWRMMLRAKSGSLRYHVVDLSTGERWTVDPAAHLEPWQLRDMSGKPDMILEFAHDLAELYRREGRGPLEIRAETLVSLNGRPPQALVDPDVDLLRQRRGLAPYDWVVPLAESLRRDR